MASRFFRFLVIPPTRGSTLFPYTTLFRSDHWQYPLSSSDPAVIDKSLNGMRTSLRNAKLWGADVVRSEEHTSELQSHSDLVCRLLLEKKKLPRFRWSAVASPASARRRHG